MRGKKIFSLLLAFAMILTMAQTAIFAETHVADKDAVSLTANNEVNANDTDAELPDSDVTLTEDNLSTTPVGDITAEETSAPTSLTINHDAKNVINGKIITKNGDKFKLTAYDQNGIETPVIWENTSYGGGGVTLDENTGEIEVTSDVYSGSTSYLYFKATSTIDETVNKQISIQTTGYLLSEYQKNQTVALSEDGQTAKTVSVTAGQSGHNIWSYNIFEGIAEPAKDPEKGNSAKFNVYRPGTFDVTFKLDINEELTDTVTVTVTGVAVEDSSGNRTKTYLSINSENPNPTVQLTGYAAEGKTISSWESANEAIATVSEDGLVTAHGVGSVIITATDSDGAKGGIKVVVESEETPYFESLEFATTAFNSGVWVKDTTFVPTKLSYDLPIKNYSTSSLMLQSTTLYDTEKYSAVAEYTDINGEKQSVTVNSGAMTTLKNQPFENSILTITISDKNNPENKTIYNFNVSRPRDTTKKIKNNGIVLSPSGRALSSTTYNGISEGAMQRADESGTLTSGTGVSGTVYFYRTFIYNDVDAFKLILTSNTAYGHIRYSTDGGNTWTETAQGGGATEGINLAENDALEVLIQVLDDAAYCENVKAGNDGFFETEPLEYKVWVDKVNLSAPKMLTAEVTNGDWYPAFSADKYSYWIVIPNESEAPVLTYTAEEGSTVKIGSTEQVADESGKYSLALATSQKSITITSADGSFTNTYKFAYKKKSALDVPDKVIDYLCIGSQYTNAGYGSNPEQTLGGSLKSLGNFGGYITYYYEEPIYDNPKNKYGMDFYVIGNSSETNIDSMAELGQVYVSEDGNTWYALAGSEHYEDKAIWDYTITYTKGDDSKAYWTDNQGNSIDYAAKNWPSASVYSMNNTANENSYTFTGVALKSQLGSITGDSSSTASYASNSKFGYADYYASNISGTTLTDVNPYIAAPSKANGFDIAWAVDENGTPIDVSEKEFHYIKIATASNIYAGSFAEKSTEVTYVVRTTAQETEVGKTAAPLGVTISDSAKSKTLTFAEGQSIYSVSLDDMKYVSVKVDGTEESDNIYINNQRVASGDLAQGFKVTKENGETLVRIIVQNGDKEPAIYLLKLTSSATESDELIEGIRINADGNVRDAETTDGVNYNLTVGHRIGNAKISLVAAPDVTYTINGSDALDSYELSYGKNTFEITAIVADGVSQTVSLTITKDNPPVSSGNTITVYFTLYGDREHGESEVHTYKDDKSSLPVWIARKAYTMPQETTVLDVFEKALTDAGLSWKNDGGNYISEIDGLAEFDNGTLSGWMYFLNNKHSDLGVAEQSLENRDRIIFYYTDDYTQEQYSEELDSDDSGNRRNDSSPVNATQNDNAAESKDNTESTENTAAVSFADVQKGAWYSDGIDFVVKNNLFKGVSESEFAPNENMTRAMLVTVLYRLEKAKISAKSNKFADVPIDEWYTDSVTWAVENNIVTGTSNTHFSPNDSTTREQMAVIIYRYAKLKGYDTGSVSNLSEFGDLDSISDWAFDAVRWANANNILNGTSDTNLSPKETATRAQVAAILMRFCENIAN